MNIKRTLRINTCSKLSIVICLPIVWLCIRELYELVWWNVYVSELRVSVKTNILIEAIFWQEQIMARSSHDIVCVIFYLTQHECVHGMLENLSSCGDTSICVVRWESMCVCGKLDWLLRWFIGDFTLTPQYFASSLSVNCHYSHFHRLPTISLNRVCH